MRIRTIAIAVLSVFILSVSLLAQVTPAQRAEIEKTLTEAQKEINASINQLSTDGWIKYASEDFQERVGSGNALAPGGKETFIKWLTNLISQRASQKVDIDSIKVFAISPESAYVLVIGGGTLVLKNGRHGGFGWASTFIWRKEPSGWKIVHYHESSW